MEFRTAFPGSRQTKRISTGGGAPVVGIVCMNPELVDADGSPSIEKNAPVTGTPFMVIW